MKLAVVLSGDSLRAGRSIDVCYRWKLRSILLSNIDSSDHVRQLGHWRHVKPLMNLLERDGRREGAESLAHLHHGIDTITHFRTPRVRQDAAVPQSPRPELHLSAVPGDHAAVGDQPGGFRAGFGERSEAPHFDAIVKLGERRFNSLRRVGWAIEGRWESSVIDLACLRRPIQCRPERGAVISGRG